tara:strand:+ start:259 stop:432 length:174 start_codon:yes stop_codon:yes gene_type:complete
MAGKKIGKNFPHIEFEVISASFIGIRVQQRETWISVKGLNQPPGDRLQASSQVGGYR